METNQEQATTGKLRKTLASCCGYCLTGLKNSVQWVRLLPWILLLFLVCAIGISLLRHRLAAELYEARLGEVTEEFERLADNYNTLVRRSAVTELLVDDNHLSICVRGADGEEKTIPTPYDPGGEIYVDFVVVDGRIWIRRVFDAKTAPSEALLVDPEFAEVDWEAENASVGKAIYRSLSEGRWVVTVSGNGTLGLERAGKGRPPLIRAPEVRSAEEVSREVRGTVKRTGTASLIGLLFREK